MKKPKSVDEAKVWLKELADYLDGVPNASSRLVYGANAIRDYLNGKEKNLDNAFGVVRSVGGQERISKNRELALVAFEKRRNGMTWEKICDDLDFYDSRELRRIVSQNMSEINELISDEIINVQERN